MPKASAQLKCRTCGKSFAASKMPDGGWRIAFDKRPPSATCRSHRGSALCRWEVHKQRRKLWEQVARAFNGRPVAFLRMTPPHRLVAYDLVADINLENEKRAMRRMLRKTLPKVTVVVTIFDISLADDTTDEDQNGWSRCSLPICNLRERRRISGLNYENPSDRKGKKRSASQNRRFQRLLWDHGRSGLCNTPEERHRHELHWPIPWYMSMASGPRLSLIHSGAGGTVGRSDCL